MRFPKILAKVLSVVALCGITMAASAAPAEPKAGVEYQVLKTAQNTEAPKKVEVLEFFAYYCPHCYALETPLSAWVKKQGANIVYRRVHVALDERVAPQERLYFTLEAMNLSEQYSMKAFQAMHVERNRLGSDEEVFNFAEKAGINRAKFIEAYNSFSVASKMRRVPAQMEAYGVDSWPMIIIDGKYRTSPSLAGAGLTDVKNEAQLHAATLEVMDFLVKKAQAEKK